MGDNLKEVKIRLTEELHEELKKYCDEHGLTISGYVRNLVEQKSDVNILIDFADIDMFAEEIQKLCNYIYAICPTILRSDKAYEQDVRLILQTLSQISTKCDEIWKFVNNTRSEMYNDVRKKAYDSVKSGNYKRRRNLRK